jgi:hypothetical protein
MNARVYDRDAVEAHRRVMAARLSARAKNSGRTGSGTISEPQDRKA